MSGHDHERLYESLRRLMLEEAPGEDAADARPAPTWEGRRLGRYLVAERIGEGSFSEVYRALHVDLQTPAAIKVLRNGARCRGDDWERFHREALCTARLAHDGIVRVQDVGREGDVPWIAMDLVEGETLRRFVAEDRPDLEQRLRIVRDVARAVEFAHGQGVVHRDLKSDNILVAPGPRAVVVDFGLARVAEDPRETREGSPLGTPGYMAPEQARGELASMDARTDVYGLGAVLFEAVTGHLPFEGSSQAEVLRCIERDPAPRLTAHAPATPPDLDAICGKCLEKDRRDRYQSAGELADDLDRHLRGEPVKARPLSLLRRAQRGVARRPRRAVAAVAALVLLAIGAEFTRRSLLEQRELRAALAIETSAKEIGLRLHHLQVEAAALRHAAVRDAGEAVVQRSDALLATLPDGHGLRGGYAAWIRFLSGDPEGPRLLARERDRHPENPMLDLLAARMLILTWVERSTWPAVQVPLYPTRERLAVAPMQESRDLARWRGRAREAVGAARASPLWPRLSLAWAQHLADAIDACATGALERCLRHLQALADRPDLEVEVGLLETLVHYRLGDLGSALAAARRLCERRPRLLLARRNLAACRRFDAMRRLAAGEDVAEEVVALQKAYESLLDAFPCEPALAEVELLRGYSADRRGADGSPWFERAVKRMDGLLAKQPGNLNLHMNRALALTSLSRRDRDGLPRLRLALESLDRAVRLAPREPRVRFQATLTRIDVVKREARTRSIDADRWESLEADLERCRTLGLGAQELRYLEGLLAFARGEAARRTGSANAARHYARCCAAMDAFLADAPRVTEVRQLWIVGAIRLTDASARPDPAVVMRAAKETATLLSGSRRYAFLDRFVPAFLDRSRERLAGSTEAQLEVARAAAEAWQRRAAGEAGSQPVRAGLLRARLALSRLETAAAR